MNLNEGFELRSPSSTESCGAENSPKQIACDCNIENEKWIEFIKTLKSDPDGDAEGPATPLDILFPEDLEKLRESLKVLKNENASLSKKLKVSEETCELLKIEVDTNRSLRNPVTGSQLATSKIVELSKKIRELTADLGASKLQCKQLEIVIQRLSVIQEASDGGNVGDAPNQLDEQKKLKKQMETLQLKLLRSRNDCEKLKSQLEAAHKVIEREVGKDAEQVLKEDVQTWTGKAEQIAALKEKVAELTHNLNMRQSCFMVNRNKVNALEAKQKEMKSEHQKEIQELKTQIEEFKKSNQGAKARYHVLEGELVIERNRIKILTEKSNTDNEMIEILKKKVKINTAEKVKEKELNKEIESQLSMLKLELDLMKTKCDNLVSALGERDERIRQQDEKIDSMCRKNGSYNDATDNINMELRNNLAKVEEERDHLKTELASNRKTVERMREAFMQSQEIPEIFKTDRKDLNIGDQKLR